MQVSNKPVNLKNVIYIFLPLLLAFILQYVTVIADIIIIFVSNLLSDERTVSTRSVNTIISQDFNQPMNLAYINLIKYILYIVCFGIWYYKVFCHNYSFKISIPSIPFISGIILSGISAQFFVDGVLALIRPIFTDAFTEYDKLVSNVTGASGSFIMWFAVIAIAPIAEELLFRGLILNYANKCLITPFAILFQGFLFGVYHGNMIQGIYAFILGSVLGLIAYKSKSIIPGILFHICLNASLLFVPDSLYKNTVSSIITTVIAFMIFTACIFVVLKANIKRTP